MSPSGGIDPAALVGRVITGALGERALPDRIEGGPGVVERRDESPYADSDLIYWHLLPGLWVEVEGVGWIFFMPGMDSFTLDVRRPEPGWFVYPNEQWRVSSMDAPAPLAALVDSTITAVKPLYTDSYSRIPRWLRWLKQDTAEYAACGLVFETTKGSVAIGNIGQDYAVGEWPDTERWEAIAVVTDPDPRRIPRLGPSGGHRGP